MTNRRPSGKSRHVDFLLEKPTRRFFIGKGDTLIFHWKSRNVGFSLEKPTRRFLVQKAETSILVEKGTVRARV